MIDTCRKENYMASTLGPLSADVFLSFLYNNTGNPMFAIEELVYCTQF